jgi:hypothetical protein
LVVAEHHRGGAVGTLPLACQEGVELYHLVLPADCLHLVEEFSDGLCLVGPQVDHVAFWRMRRGAFLFQNRGQFISSDIPV